MIKQISIFMKNEKGRLTKVAKILGDAKIDIRALTIAETADFGILRLIVNDPAHAYSVLKANDVAVVEHNVLAVELDDSPGGLARITGIVTDADINIEYIYAFVTKSHEKAYVVLRLDDRVKGREVLEENNIRLLGTEDIKNL